MQFAKAKHLYRIWKLIKSMLSASTERIAALEKIFLLTDTGEDLLVITDAAYRILAAIDRNGRGRFEVGLTSREAITDGNHEIKGVMSVSGTRMMESDDYGLYYILDKDDTILFMIDREGNTDFKGMPADIGAKFSELEARIANLENK